MTRRRILLLCALSALAPAAARAGAGEPCLIDSIDEPEGFVKIPALREDVLLVPRTEGDPPEWDRATVYRRSGGQWLTEAVLKPVNKGESNNYGIGRALGDGVIVIGDNFFPVDQPLSGAAFVYRYSDDEHDDADQWRLEAMLTAPETDPLPFSSRVANAVAIDDEVVIAGAPGHDVNDAVHAGAAFVFRNGPDGWQYETMLSSPDPAEWGGFGWAVALKNGVAIIGAHGTDGPAPNTGRAFVFRYIGDGWRFEQELMPPDPGSPQWFGWSVALDHAAETAVIGAIEDTVQNGAAYVFRHGDFGWVYEQKLAAAEPSGIAPWFGSTVSIDAEGEVILASAPGDSEIATEAGAAYLFRYDGEQWNEAAKIISPEPMPFGKFGSGSMWQDRAALRQGGSNSKVFYFAGLQGLDCTGNGVANACDIHSGEFEDTTGTGIPDVCEQAGDLNGDGAVNGADLGILLSQWGECLDPDACPADLTGDGHVSGADLGTLLSNWTADD